MKYWQEYYLAKHKRKHCSGINVDDFDKIISWNCMCLNWQLGVNFNVHMFHKWCSRYGGQAPLQNMCLYPPFL